MNPQFITRALCFHGQPMQKIWEGERGAGDLQQCGVPLQTDYSVYQERQKHFTFQDRAKRLKLHQFLARKAKDLYDSDLTADAIDDKELEKSKPYFAILPPYESFIKKNQDKVKLWRSVLEGVKPGDIIYGVVNKIGNAVTTNTPMMVKPLCTAEPIVRYLGDIPTKAFVHYANIPTQPLSKNGKPRNYAVNDYVCCEVLEVSVDADRLYLGMEGVLTKNKNLKLGVINLEELPEYYRKAHNNAMEKYEEHLHKTKEFLNPNYDILFQINGIKVNDTFTMMNSLKSYFPRQEYAKELRQTQASKWAFRSVAEGIEHFKIGHHVEAFQCLNRALNIDPRNVEGLVARGALYANKGSFLKAVEDFEKALKLNSYHVNARKYMGETLVAIGRRYEDENRIQDAAKAYMDCLNIIPNHEQARLSLEAIQQRSGGLFFENVLNASGTNEVVETQKKKREISDASSSDDSSSENSGSSSEAEHSDANRKKEASMSPLSKRMALHAASLAAEGSNQQFNQPFYMANYNNNNSNANTATTSNNPNEFKLDDDDTEKRVRKLLHEASKHKKEKSKKSKKKKSKKAKKKEKDTTAILDKINFQEAYKAISGLNIENKLTENLHLYEKTIAEIKKRQEVLKQSISNSSSLITAAASHSREKSDTPPPRAPPMVMPPNIRPLFSSSLASRSIAAAQNDEAPKLSFQIKRPVKIDKFGLVRIATPLAQKSPTRTPSPTCTQDRQYRRHRQSRSRSRTRSRSPRSRSRSTHSSYRSRRSSPQSRGASGTGRSNRDIGRQSRSKHSPPRRRRTPKRSRGGGDANRGRRRTPSPFVPRSTPPPRRRNRSRSRDISRKRSRRSPSLDSGRPKFGNRVWKRPGYDPPSTASSTEEKNKDGRWLHDKFNDDAAPRDDGPSIEEIDEIINKAQKERKQEIINRDKNILKKPAKSF